ncbi:LysR family transcriptional regulator [Hoeflea sp. WL0058]|uniref:LysR family transcriptional regulator n=1 Tax=Flavimaribacter sediminis TaxID=2865987 RepID=A0AAE2ZJD2_9HYPH|nr:LysR substrate-binding domain-containing protein [Flavimaribacter sediminis]MBW8635595.1 LysR family transcriptional regulator [Flavimaribacter sediminis]
MNLSFRQLQTFVEVMRVGSVSEAGRSLGRTQPAVSAMISGLEKEIGFPLFERDRGRLVAKPEAHYFLEEAEFVLERLSQSTRTLHDIGNLQEGKLRIACNPAASSIFMPKVLGMFLKDKPNVEASLMMRSSPVVVDWVASQQYDVGLAESPNARKTVQAEKYSLPCMCALPAGDPLLEKDVLTPADLDNLPMALLYDDHTITQQCRKAFAEAGARLNQRFELRTFAPTLRLVSQGLCYTICETLSAISHAEGLGHENHIEYRPFKPEMSLNMSVLTPANRPLSMLAAEFTKLLKEQVAGLQDPARMNT